MNCQTFHRVAGVFFAAVALAHGVRALLQVPIVVGDTSVPVWLSWAALVIVGSLSYWAFSSTPST